MKSRATFAELAKLTPHTRQAALERQDSSCTYMAHHELENVNFIIIYHIYYHYNYYDYYNYHCHYCYHYYHYCTQFLGVCSQGLQCEGRTSEWALYIPHRKRKRPFSCWMAWVGTLSVASSTAAANALASCSMYLRSLFSACITPTNGQVSEQAQGDIRSRQQQMLCHSPLYTCVCQCRSMYLRSVVSACNTPKNNQTSEVTRAHIDS